MARKAAAIPQLVRINCRRFKPSDLPLRSANSLMRASTFFWIALCEGGKYSPFETIWVGTGVAADAASAPATRRCSRSLSQLPIVRPPCLVIDQLPVVNGRRLHPGSAQIMTGLRVCVLEWHLSLVCSLWFRRRAHASHLAVISAVDLANGQGRGLGLAHRLESGSIVSQKALCV